MPAFLEAKLKKEYGEDSKVPYKVMNSLGVMHGNKETAKGKEWDEKHASDVAHGIGHDHASRDPSSNHGRTFEPIQEFDRVATRAQRAQNAKKEFRTITTGTSLSLQNGKGK